MKSTKPSICIFGPGVVGYATGLAFQEKKFKVGFIGRNEEKAKKLQKEGFWSYTFDSFPDHSFEFDISFHIATPPKTAKFNLMALKMWQNI
jgi:ketopantoate reductase